MPHHAENNRLHALYMKEELERRIKELADSAPVAPDPMSAAQQPTLLTAASADNPQSRFWKQS